MEPRIQYAKTSVGVSIAYSVMGEGPPLVRVPTPGIEVRANVQGITFRQTEKRRE